MRFLLLTDPAHPVNVVVVLTDQQRWDTTGLGGCPLDLTPNLDRLGRAGTYATCAVTPQPVCAPARAAFQTGRWPTDTGVYRNNIPLPKDARTLGHYFAEAGYETALIGKWHLASADPVPLEERAGYEYWLAANLLEFTSDAYHTTVFDTAGQPVELPGYRADALTDAAIRFLTHRDHSRPFLLVLSLLEPHHQNHTDSYPAPVGYAERYQGRWMPADLAALDGNAAQSIGGYFGQVKRVDECLGRITDALISLGVNDDTVLAYTADHGNHFKTRNEEYKRSCHDSSVRVPMVLSGSVFTGGGQITEPVSLLDLAPTLCDAAGLPLNPDFAGRSLLDAVRNHGRSTDIGWRPASLIQISESQVGRAMRSCRWKYAIRAPGLDGWDHPGARDYVEDALYDLDSDPHELANLVAYATFEPVLEECRRTITRLMMEAGEVEPRISPAIREPAGQRSPEPSRAAPTRLA